MEGRFFKDNLSVLGSVGIGTTNPLNPLDVVGYIKSSIGFKAGNYTTILESGNESVFGNTAYYGVSFKTNNATRMKITNAGNVGINTTSPSQKLEVVGAAVFGGSATKLTTYSDSTYSGIFNGSTLSSDESIYFGSGHTYFINDGSASLTIDQTGNLGIGTTGPTRKLSVHNSAAGSIANFLHYTDASNYQGLYIDVSQTTDIVNLKSSGATSGGFAFFAGSDEKIRFDSNGKVGIGITDPDNTLHVNSGGTNSVARFQSTDATARILFQDNSGQAGVGATGDDIVFTTSSSASERMRIDSSGSVGIGTASPSYDLDVIGDISSNGQAIASYRRLRSYDDFTTSTNNTAGWYPLFNWGTTTGSRGGYRVYISYTGGSWAPNTTVLKVYKNWSDDATIAIEKYGGTLYLPEVRVIGDASSATVYTLEVYLNALSQGHNFSVYYESLGHDGAGASNVNWANSSLALSTNTGSVIASAKVSSEGIATSNLNISNDIYLGDQIIHMNDSNTFFQFPADDTMRLVANSVERFNIETTETVVNQSGGNHDFRVEGDTDPNLLFVDAGTDRVGIGTTSPYNLLHVDGDARINSLIVGNSGATNTPNAHLHVKASGTGAVIRIEDSDNSNRVWDLWVDEGNGFYITDKGTGSGTDTRLYIEEGTGKIGIGTTNPRGPLEVHAASDSTLVIERFTSNGIQLRADNSADSAIRLGFEAYTYEFKNGSGTSRLHIDSSGNVGINTTSPQEKLHVNGNVRGDSFGSEQNTTSRIFSPAGATYNGSSSQTGYLIVKLPDNGATGINNMMSGVIRVFDYTTHETFDVHFAGYWYSGYNWTNQTAWIENSPHADRNFTVRFGKSTGTSGIEDRPFITIGESNSTWSYVKFSVVTYTAGHANVDLEKWNSGWATSLSTSLPGTVLRSVGNTQANNWKRNDNKVYYNTGNVGIGTASPDGVLHLASTASSVQRLIFSNSNANLNPQQRIEFWEGTGTGTAANANCAIEYDGTGTYQSSDGTLLIKGNGSSVDLPIAGFNRNGNVYLGMSGIARVGIGTTSPGAKLDINDTGQNQLVVRGWSFDGTGASAGAIQIGGTDAYSGRIWVDNSTTKLHIANTYNNSNGDIMFHTKTSGTTIDAMTIKGSGNVGVGTTSPTAKIHVKDASGSPTGLAAIIDRPNNLAAVDQTADNPELLISGHSSNYKLVIRDHSSNELMVVKGDGKVGINTTSPKSPLTVQTDASANSIQIYGRASDNGSDIDFFANDTTTRKARIFIDSNGFNISGQATGASNFIIDSSGKVGIGTNNPSYKLHVFGSGFTESSLNLQRTDAGTDNDPNIIFTANSSANTGIALGGLWYQNTVDNNYNAIIRARTDNNAGTSGRLDFVTGIAVTNSTVPSMVIKGDGNVGIGTVSPAGGKLQVAGKVRIDAGSGNDALNLNAYDLLKWDNSSHIHFGGYKTGQWTVLKFYSSSTERLNISSDVNVEGATDLNINGPSRRLRFTSGTGTIRTTTSNKLFLQTNSTDALTIDATQNVGIGATNPSQKLHVVGKALITDDVQLTGSNPRIDFNTNGASSLRFYDTTNTAERMRINTSGNLGVNTTSPTSKLQVVGSASGDSVLKVDGTNGTLFEVVDDLSDSLMSVNDAAGLPVFEVFADNHIVAGRYNQNDFYLDTNGNLGLGTSAPSSVLDIYEQSGKDNKLRFHNDTTGSGTSNGSRIGLNGAELFINNIENSAIKIYTQSTQTNGITILGDGKVGIGTTGPDERLHVFSSSDPTIKIGGGVSEGTTGGTSTLQWWANNGSVGNVISATYYKDASNDRLTFIDGGAVNILTLENGGKVGIGTTIPGDLVHIRKDQDSETALYLQNNNDAAGAGTTLRLAVGGPNSSGDVRVAMNVGNGGSDWALGIDNSDNDKFKISGGTDNNNTDLGTNTRLTIDGSGKVGIGNTSPSQKLHVSGSALVEGALYIGSTNSINLDSSTIYRSNNSFKIIGGGPQSTRNHIELTNGGGLIIDGGSSESAGVEIKGGGGVVKFTQGSVGIGTSNPTRKLHIVGNVQLDGTIDANSGAYLTSGGVWTDASSRELKKDIINLSLIKASEVVKLLNPVEFSYKATPEERRVGFIAEDVPDLVASEGRKGLSSMQIVAALTKVVQNQQKEIEWCKEQIEKLNKKTRT